MGTAGIAVAHFGSNNMISFRYKLRNVAMRVAEKSFTANGVEFHDRAFIPPRIVRRDAREPWRSPIGFILPKSGRFTATSSATVIATPGLAVVLRPSDTRVP